MNAGGKAPRLSVRLWLPVILSTTAGTVDVIGFLALGGLFTAHITGNLVVVAAHYATGSFRQSGPLLAVPVFVAVLGVVVLVFSGLARTSNSRRPLLVLHAALLAGCWGLGLGFGPFTNASSPMAVLVGMLAVAAMATQNAMVKLTLVKAPSTAVMTTNTTQLIVDLATLVRSGEALDDVVMARQRARVTLLCIFGFAGGCVAGAVLELHLGLGALVLPVILAALTALLDEGKEETSDSCVRLR